MLIILYLAGLVTALYWVSKLLLPEMAKSPLPRPIKNPKSLQVIQDISSDAATEKLETLLAEKNKNISFLQAEIKKLYAQTHSFNKVKTLLEEEIHRLREQNRIFRSELGLPAAQSKENSIT